MRNYFLFDNTVRSIDYGVLISGEATYNAPARDITPITIPGRDGVLTMDNGRFFEIQHTYPAFIIDGFDTKIEAFRNIMMSKRGRTRLLDTYHPNEYYLVYYESGLEAEVTRLKSAGSFDITFMRDPRRFLTSGDNIILFQGNYTVTNPTLFPAKPLITVYGTGTLGIGSESVTISYADGYTVLDSETQDAYKGTVNCNQYVTMTSDDFPVLPPGNTTFTLGTGITQVMVIPRWYIL